MLEAPKGGVRRHLNYSNLMSTLAVFLVLAGGSALAATVAKNSVKSKSVKDGSLQGRDVRNDTLTGAQIQEASLDLPQQALPGSLPPSGPAGGDLAGEYPNPAVGADAIGSAEVAADALDASDLAPNSVGSSEVVDDSLGAGDIASGGVGFDELAQNSVRAPQANAGGSSTENFGTIAANACASETVAATPRDGSLLDDVIVVTPPPAFTGSFTIHAESSAASNFQLKVCNAGSAPDDPDGVSGGSYRFIAFDT